MKRSRSGLKGVTNGKARGSTRILRGLGVAAAVLGASACHELDTTRQAPKKATLGDDLYGVFCDRVGSDVFTEDLVGASYRPVCHFNEAGVYGDTVDESVLPPVRGEKATEARRLSIAKVEAMGRRRSDLIRAFNSAFPDITIDNPATPEAGDTIRLHDALMSLAQTLTPLYESNPYDPNPEATPLMPQSTRSIGRLFAGLVDSPDARQALTQIWGRQGYRPSRVGLGAIRPLLAYPRLRDLAKASVGVLGPDGMAVPQLQQLLTVSKRELIDSEPVVAPLAPYFVDPITAQPNRSRSTVEVAAALLTSQDPSFAESDSEPPRFIVRRDKRGFAVPLGSAPGMPGTIPAPFSDLDGDGFADVDPFGRFVDGSGSTVALDAPFMIPGVSGWPVDEFQRPQAALYEYVDTSRALTGSLARNMVPLFDATEYGSPGDPDAWKDEHETMMYALAGAYQLYGGREPAQYDYTNEVIRAEGEACDNCVSYSRFRAEDSPIPDLVHAVGQILADQDSDAILLSLIDLLENHEQVVARLLGAALRVQEIAKEHDQLALEGKEPMASLAYETPIWDEMAEVLARITRHPGLTAKLLEALAEDDIVTPHGASSHMGETVARFMQMRDELTYDQQNVNGPAVNLTDGAPSTADMHNPVDRTPPLEAGTNRSCFQKSLQAIHDASHVKACNKAGATIHADLLGIGVEWPLIGSYDECELFTFENLATFYLNANLPDGHPKRSELKIDSNTLNGLLDFIGGDSAADLFVSSSGITGLTLFPDPAAMNRLVFFGADSEQYPNMPDHDFVNQGSQTNLFVSGLIEPIAPIVCPLKANGVRDCGAAQEDLFRLRDGRILFLWERLGFLDYLRPMVTRFANVGCSEDGSFCDDPTDLSGSEMFVDLLDVMHRHWAGPEHGDECNTQGAAENNALFCSEAGVNTYEPIMTDAFMTDLIPALHEFAKVARDFSEITVQRGPKQGDTVRGTEILELVTRILFDPEYAAGVGMVDRRGNKATKWVNGKDQPQLTGFTLFADALHKIDVRFQEGGADGEARKAQWKRARSQLVDQFLAVEGEGTEARFKNRGMARTMVALLKVAREQLNAHCPDRENGVACGWAKQELGDKMAATVSGPLFAGIMDVQESIRLDPPARRELERFLSHNLLAASDGDALQAMLASMSDMLQVLSDDAALSPIFNAIATAASPAGDVEGPGCADTTVKMLKAIVDERYDTYHVLDHVLSRLVTPMDDGQGLSPVEIMIDTIADVQRLDASRQDGLTDEDYKNILGSVEGFLTSETRGLEQFYFVVQNRPRE